MKNILLTLTSLLISSFLLTQTGKIEIKANKQFEKLAYHKAINNYKQIHSDLLSIEGLRNYAEALRKTNQTELAEKKYQILVFKDNSIPEDYFQFAEMQLMNNKPKKADIWMEKFHNKLISDSRGQKYVAKKGSYNKLKEDIGKYEITNLDANSAKDDFGPAYYGDKLVFTSSRKSKLAYKMKWNWNEQPFLNIFEADRLYNNQLIGTNLMNKKINKKYHDGPACFSKDGSFMIFTRNNYAKKNDKGERKLEMFYQYKNDEGNWNKPVGFDFNNKNYSVGHPSISNDGKTIYFVSDMPGGKGLTDIYKVNLINGNWSAPINLGEEINTEGREMFPFYHENGMLFFASDGHVGLGGLDIFVSKVDTSNLELQEIKNIGYPINTSKDDFALILNSEENNGYFSSNREGGKGGDDIYNFNLLKPFTFCNEIKGLALNKNNDFIAGTVIKLIDSSGLVIKETITNNKGEYNFCVKPGKYRIIGSKEKYFNGENKASLKEIDSEPLNANVILEKDPGFSLMVNVKDEKSKKNLTDVTISFNNKLDKNTTNTTSDVDGNGFQALKNVRLNSGVNYTVTLEKEGYLSKTVSFSEKLVKPGIQKLNVILSLIPKFSLYTLITDKKTGKPLDEVFIKLINNTDNSTEKIILPITGKLIKGIINKKINDNISYQFVISRDGYLSKTITYNTKLKKEGRYDANLKLDFGLHPLEVGKDLSKLIDIKPINFDVNKFNIRPDAQIELNKVVEVMNEYPGMFIELGSHTDCRGSKKYNKSLSDKRAKASAKFVAGKITNPFRIYGKGYGEEELLNDCACEGKIRVKCNDSKHNVNRRTELKITKFEAKGVKERKSGEKYFENK